jgi:hypothetical protein
MYTAGAPMLPFFFISKRLEVTVVVRDFNRRTARRKADDIFDV